MVAVTRSVATDEGIRFSTDDTTLSTVLFGLRRSHAVDAISDQLYDDLNAVLDEGAGPTPDETSQIVDRFRNATTKLVEGLPYLVTSYPIEEVRLLTDLSAQQPDPAHERQHLVRFALTILEILDLVGDVVP